MATATEQILESIQKLNDRQGKLEEALQKAAEPASKSGLTMAQLVALSAGGDGATLMPNGAVLPAAALLMGRKRLAQGCGMGAALRAIADLAKHQIGTSEAIEKNFGFQTLDRYKSEGMKGADGAVHKAALAEGSGQTGGYVLAPQFSNKLLELSVEEAVVRPRATVLPMSSRTLSIPSLDVTTAQAAGTTPFIGGILAQWQPEAATLNESEPQFRQTEITAYDLVFYTVASNQLLADNAVALDALLTQLFAKAIEWYTEYAWLRGTGSGSSMPLGVLNAPATLAVNRTAPGHFRLADAATMMSKLLAQSWPKAVWLMHQSVLPDLIQMSDNSAGGGNGRLVWVNPAPPSPDGGVANRIPAMLLGAPVFFTEKLPVLGTKGDVMLCDFGPYLIGDRQALQVDVSPHYKFLNNQMVWRIIARLGGLPWLNNVVTLADGSYTVSPFIALN